MINPAPVALTFAQLDDLAFAAERGRLTGNTIEDIKLSAVDLGPILELHQLAVDGRLPQPRSGTWLAYNGTSDFFRAIKEQRRQWLCPRSRSSGFLFAEAQPAVDQMSWTSFGLAAQQAAVGAGFSKKISAQLVGAIMELQSNIYEHSGAPETGLLAFNARPGVFEFVATDHGMGVLESLRSGPAHSGVPDYGSALQLALTEGCSRYGDEIGRGMGFRPLFVGLANLQGTLRFRSGDHALTIDGDRPKLVMARVAQKPQLQGFFASVRCSLRSFAKG
jgi:hypothetical protein